MNDLFDEIYWTDETGQVWKLVDNGGLFGMEWVKA